MVSSSSRSSWPECRSNGSCPSTRCPLRKARARSDCPRSLCCSRICLLWYIQKGSCSCPQTCGDKGPEASVIHSQSPTLWHSYLVTSLGHNHLKSIPVVVYQCFSDLRVSRPVDFAAGKVGSLTPLQRFRSATTRCRNGQRKRFHLHRSKTRLLHPLSRNTRPPLDWNREQQKYSW